MQILDGDVRGRRAGEDLRGIVGACRTDGGLKTAATESTSRQYNLRMCALRDCDLG
jgi:hypothetical protein